MCETHTEDRGDERMLQQFAQCMNCDAYIYNFRFLQLSGLSPKLSYPGRKQEPLQAAQVHGFPGPLAGWEKFGYLDKLIKDTLFTLGEIHSQGR